MWRLLLALEVMIPSAYADNPSSMVVRTCGEQPTAAGWSACMAPQWSTPSAYVILDVQRRGMAADLWIPPSPQIIAPGDRVFVCLDANVQPGAWVDCPSFLPGQTSNWMDISLIDFSGPPQAVLPLTWQAVTTTEDGSPLPVGMTVLYEVFTRSNNCSVPPNASEVTCQKVYPVVPNITTSGVSAQVTLAPGPWCAVTTAFWSGMDPGSSRSAASNEVCTMVVQPQAKPAAPPGLTAH